MPEFIPSPCIQRCQMDKVSGYCAGCLRTLDEISAWSRLDNTQKNAVLGKLAARRQRLNVVISRQD
ncbi:MAG: DUF1289 domain-containing protein [Azonexus sp.]|jgi:predicted Fe-S protein YdhL (DUF1289 family)|nr:DUF1289 domain-containing protein [Azonexus sp.]